jgi:hypothetical protein
MATSALRSSSRVKRGVEPNSVMLARMGTLSLAKARYFDAGGSAVEGGVEAFGGESVGAGHDDEGGVGAGVYGGLDAVDHLFSGDNLLVGAMAAALGLDLVFDVAAGGSGLDEGAYGAREIEGATETGVDVDEEW